MSKAKHFVINFIWVSPILVLLADLTVLCYLHIASKNIIHNLESDLVRDHWRYICLALLAILIPLTVVSAIRLLFIYRRKMENKAQSNQENAEAALEKTSIRKTENKAQSNQENAEAALTSSIEKTFIYKLILNEDFDKAFMPFFASKGNTSGGDSKLAILKSALLEHIWSRADLGRIALLIFDSGVLKPEYTKLIPWIKYFFKIVGRTDIPKSPSRRDFAFNDSEECKKLLIIFNNLVDTAIERNPNFLEKIKRTKE